MVRGDAENRSRPPRSFHPTRPAPRPRRGPWDGSDAFRVAGTSRNGEGLWGRHKPCGPSILHPVGHRLLAQVSVAGLPFWGESSDGDILGSRA